MCPIFTEKTLGYLWHDEYSGLPLSNGEKSSSVFTDLKFDIKIHVHTQTHTHRHRHTHTHTHTDIQTHLFFTLFISYITSNFVQPCLKP